MDSHVWINKGPHWLARFPDLLAQHGICLVTGAACNPAPDAGGVPVIDKPSAGTSALLAFDDLGHQRSSRAAPQFRRSA